MQPLCTGLLSCLCLQVPARPGQTLEPGGLQQLWGYTVLDMGSIPGQIPARLGSKPEGCCPPGRPKRKLSTDIGYIVRTRGLAHTPTNGYFALHPCTTVLCHLGVVRVGSKGSAHNGCLQTSVCGNGHFSWEPIWNHVSHQDGPSGSDGWALTHHPSQCGYQQ